MSKVSSGIGPDRPTAGAGVQGAEPNLKKKKALIRLGLVGFYLALDVEIPNFRTRTLY